MRKKLKVTRTQKKFLEAYRQNPAGPPPEEWPSALVFRRWLRHRDFRKAIIAVRDALRFQADLHLASASAAAAQSVLRPDAPLQPQDHKRYLDLLQLSHMRQRFAHLAPPDQDRGDDDDDDDFEFQKLTPEQMEDRDRHYPYLVRYHNDTQNVEGLKEWIVFLAYRDEAFRPFLAQFPDALERIRQRDEVAALRKQGIDPYDPDYKPKPPT